MDMLEEVVNDISAKTDDLIKNMKSLQFDVTGIKIDLAKLRQEELIRFKRLTGQISDVSGRLYKMIEKNDKKMEY